MARYRVGNSFATLPFDKLDSVSGGYIHEDFIMAGALADAVDDTGVVYEAGATRWWAAEIGGAAVGNITKVVSVAGHQGIIGLEVGATSPADGDAIALQLGGDANTVQDSVLLDSSGVYIATMLRIQSTLAATKVEFGLIGQTPVEPNSSALDLIAFVYDPEDSANVGDAFWFAQVNDNGTDVEEVLSLAPIVQDEWTLLEIAATSTDAVFRITTEDNIQTVSIPHTVTVALRPSYVVENVTTTEGVIDIDIFHMRYLRREDNIMEQLGA